MRMKMLSAAFLGLALFAGAAFAQTPAPAFDTKAKQILLVDAETGTVLFSRAENDPIPPASLAKLMTMEVVAEALGKVMRSLETKAAGFWTMPDEVIAPGRSTDVAAVLDDLRRPTEGRMYDVELALRLGAPALVLVMPAVSPMLPGLRIFRGMYESVSGSLLGATRVAQSGVGVTTMLGAVGIALALSTGALLGDVLSAPFDRPIVQRRRARRR